MANIEGVVKICMLLITWSEFLSIIVHFFEEKKLLNYLEYDSILGKILFEFYPVYY